MSMCELKGHDVGQYFRKEIGCTFGCYTPTFQANEDPVINFEMYVSVPLNLNKGQKPTRCYVLIDSVWCPQGKKRHETH